MYNKSSKSVLLFVTLFIFSSTLFSQDIGKIFSKTEADELFGEVLEEKAISKDALISVLQHTEKVIMFTIKNNNLIIKGDERALLFGSDKNLDQDEVFHLFSKNKVEELINLGKENSCIIEIRAKVLSITNGDFTLEMSEPCPPNC